MAQKDSGSGLDRRTYLQYAGAAAVTASFAGCISGEDELTETETQTEAKDEQTTETEDDAGQDQDGEFEVRITQGQMDSGLDPQDHRETNTDVIVMQAYEGTLDRDPEGQVIEGLATDWERVDEGTVRLQIREDVTFHSGDALTPSDVAFSINRIVKEDVGGLASPQSDQLAGITEATVVDGERAVDVHSDGVNPIVFGLLATYGDIMQQSWVEDRESGEINTEMNGTGPFKLDSYVEDERIELSRFEEYWQGPADADRVTFTAASESSTRVNQLENGETDIIVNVPPQDAGRLEQNEGTRVEAVPSTRVIFNAMRYDVEPFSSEQFRQAMNYAVDLESIIENVISGFADPTGQPTLEGFTGYNPDVDIYPYDPDQAESLVEESGHAGVEIELHTPVGRYLKDLEIAQAVASFIDDLPNVSCRAQQRDFSSLVDELLTGNIEDKPHFYLIGWGNAAFDASQTIIPLLTTDGALTSYSDDEVDELMAQSQDEADDETREQQLREANQLINERAPWIFLNRQYSVYGVNDSLDWQARRDEAIRAYAVSRKQ